MIPSHGAQDQSIYPVLELGLKKSGRVASPYTRYQRVPARVNVLMSVMLVFNVGKAKSNEN